MKKNILNPALYILSAMFASGLLMTGCDDKAELPSFIRIDTIMVDSTDYDSVGSVLHKVEYAWVYLDDNLQGVYQLPALFPVIGEGTKNIRVFGGVKESGFSSQASRYIFYDSWLSTISLTVGDTAAVSPHIRYGHLLIPYMEDFDNNTSISVDRESGGGNFAYTFDGDAKEGPGYGMMTLTEGATDLVCTTSVVNTPKNELGYFVEMDYKNNCDFFVGIKTPEGNETILGILPKADWNKIYINITNNVDQLPGTDLQLYFIVPQDTTIPYQEVKIDNLKLLF